MPNPLELLGLPETATESEVRQRWRALLHEVHPDVGGNVVQFRELRAAYQEALDLVHNRQCPRCGGTGFVLAGVGGITVKVRCSSCD